MFLLIIFGIIGGILGGMGMGGGTLLIPLLTIFAGLNQQISQAINLLAFIPMSIVVLIIHFKNKLVDFKTGIWLIIFGSISTVFGSLLANIINTENLKIYFAIFLIVLGVFQFISLKFFKKC